MIDLLYKSAPLHDIGKIGMCLTHILLKPGQADGADEFEIMPRPTPRWGASAIEECRAAPGYARGVFWTVAKEIAYQPPGKLGRQRLPRRACRGDAIPVSARLMALADVYDALISTPCVQAGGYARTGL
jgi:putative two-component system response regulator